MARKPLSRKSNKKLTKRQKSKVRDNLQKRIEALRAQNAQEATVISHMGYNVIVQTTPDAPLLACDWRQNIGAICAGDQVLIIEHTPGETTDAETNVETGNKTDAPEAADDTADVLEADDNSNYRIEAVLPRRTVIEKQNVYRGAKPFAANIDQMLIIITHQPMFQPSLLDRYLLMARVVGIDALIYFNKTDILNDPETIAHIDRMQAVYQTIPHTRWVRGSLRTAHGLDALKSELDNRKTVITGQSGVGKSTLINALIPDIDVQTMSISTASGLGRHSTTNSTLYRLDKTTMHRGILIDTPGVRSFDTYHLTPAQINSGFADIQAFLGHCQFSDCSHTHEKSCALKNAVAAGKISAMRYDSFLQILTESQQYDNDNR